GSSGSSQSDASAPAPRRLVLGGGESMISDAMSEAGGASRHTAGAAAAAAAGLGSDGGDSSVDFSSSAPVELKTPSSATGDAAAAGADDRRVPSASLAVTPSSVGLQRLQQQQQQHKRTGSEGSIQSLILQGPSVWDLGGGGGGDADVEDVSMQDTYSPPSSPGAISTRTAS
ncbi:unnamed protein product, partial [Ectocarpus sp. 4 AP-2014]